MNSTQMVLRDLFDETFAELQRMRVLLEQEAFNLKGNHADALNRTTQQKEAVANSLEALANRQENLLRALKLPAGKEGIEAVLSTLPATDPTTTTVRTIWLAIIRLTATCQKLNEINGSYIGLLRQHVRRSLDILHGQSSQDVVYGPDGLGRHPEPSRKLLSA